MSKLPIEGGVPGTPVINFQLSAIGSFSHNGDPEAYGGRRRGGKKRRRFDSEIHTGFQVLSAEELDEEFEPDEVDEEE